MAQPLRIAFVFRAPLGGLFRHVLDVARGLIERGHQVGIICDCTPGNDHSERMLAALAPRLGLGLVRFPIGRNPSLADIGSLVRTRRVLRDWAPDIVHGHGSKGGLFARLAPARIGGRRVVRAYTPHGGSLNYAPGSIAHRFYMMVERLLSLRTELLLFESDYARRRYGELVGAPACAARVARNGLEAAEFRPIVHKTGSADLVYVGEFRTAKGLPVLFAAVGIAGAKLGRKLRLILVGSGPDEASLKRLIAEMGMQETTNFLTPRPIREALAEAAIIVIPSLIESLPYVGLEAAAAGQPTVATNVGGIPEIFGPYAAALVPGGNARGLADAIVAMVAMPAGERTARAAAISAYVHQNFTIAQMLEGVMSGYADALGQVRSADGAGKKRQRPPRASVVLHP